MAYNFPDNPIPGQVYVPPFGGQSYMWQPPHWLVMGIPPTGGSGVGFEEAPVDGQLYGRQDAAWSVMVPLAYDWDDIGGKPATFPPTLPIPSSGVTGFDLKADITYVDAADASMDARLDALEAGAGTVTWGNVTGKPATFPPDAHTHAYSSLTGIPATFAPSAHTHSYSSLTGIPSTFAPSAHVHTIAEITGLDTALAGKASTTVADTGAYATKAGIVDADTISGFDSAAANAKSKWTWAVVKSTLLTYFNTIYPTLAGANTFTATQKISGVAPTLHFNDTDHRDHFLHSNANQFYVLAAPDAASESWAVPHPFQLNSDAQLGYCYGNKIMTAANVVVSTAAPSGGVDGDVWFTVV